MTLRMKYMFTSKRNLKKKKKEQKKNKTNLKNKNKLCNKKWKIREKQIRRDVN